MRRGAEAHLFNVVDFPDEGLPTRPIRGSRGMVEELKKENKWVSRRKSKSTKSVVEVYRSRAFDKFTRELIDKHHSPLNFKR